MTKVVNLVDLMRQVGEATGAIQAEIKEIDTKLRSLYDKHSELVDSPVSLDEVLGYLDEYLGMKADTYVSAIRKAIKTAPLSFGQLEQGRIENFPIQSGDPYVLEHTEAALIYIHRDAILAGYRKVLEEVGTFSESALTLAERRKEISRIDGEMAELKKCRAELVTALDQVGSKR
jgi:DNA anti-recombination protein RmuC